MLTQCRKSLFLDAGDLHLRNAENFGRFVLRQAVKIAQADDHLLAVGELGDRLAQRNAFQYFLLHFSLGQDVLQRKAVLAGAPLQGLRRAGGCLGYGDVLRLQGRGFAQLCQRWLAYNFTKLNIEEGHPSRDRSDTFYFDDDDSVLLRTQTSPMQIRVMEQQKPPIRMLAPGRVFRKDEADATHSPMFHQIEGLVVDEGITMGDLKGALETLIKRLYGEDAVVRFRPHHFPFTEPSCEVDMQCFKCHGTGETAGQVCSTCHGEGWIELLGAGMVHPKVLEGCGIDPKKYSGFAFGIGLERMAMGRLRINDLRLIFDNDVRFLSQF